MNGSCSICFGGGGGTGNGLAIGNSFVSVGGINGIDGPTGKADDIPPPGPPIDIGGSGLPILGGLIGTGTSGIGLAGRMPLGGATGLPIDIGRGLPLVIGLNLGSSPRTGLPIGIGMGLTGLPIEIGGVGLPLIGLKGTPLPTGRALALPPRFLCASNLRKLITLSQYRYIAQTFS